MTCFGWDNRLTSQARCQTVGQFVPPKPLSQQLTSTGRRLCVMQAAVVARSHELRSVRRLGCSVQGPQLSLLGPPMVADVNGNSFPKHRHPPVGSNAPQYALAHSSSPTNTCKVWGLFFCYCYFCVCRLFFLFPGLSSIGRYGPDPPCKHQ